MTHLFWAQPKEGPVRSSLGEELNLHGLNYFLYPTLYTHLGV